MNTVLEKNDWVSWLRTIYSSMGVSRYLNLFFNVYEFGSFAEIREAKVI